MRSIKTTDNPVIEVISAYTATNQQLNAVAAAPAWQVVGGFYMPRTEDVVLEVVGSVSLAGVVLTCRLFDVANAEEVDGSVTDPIDGTLDERQVSGAIALTGKRVYQIQAQCIGNPAEYGIVRAATLV